MTVSVPPLPRMGSSGRPWQSLHWRLQRILALTFASALIVVFWAINWEIERTLVRVFEDRARGSAEQIANLVGPPVLHGIEQLQRLADQDSTFRDFLKHRSMTAVETLRATLARMGSNTPRRIALWPADGTGSID